MNRRETLGALAGFTLLTLVFTWPLARGLTRDLPGDLGDPVLNAWIVAWDAGQIGRLLSGDAGGLADYWHPKIFAPHPLALAYSEHLTPQALQALPFHLATGNPVLSYNLLFLSTFVLSAFGMFLFVRALTGSFGAALVAGLAFGFAPYRIAAIPHLQVLSSAWMPFTLFFLRRFFDTRRGAPLAWAAAAWTAQNLSCGYYLFFFSPVVAAYVGWELTARRLWRDTQVLRRLAMMAAAAGLATVPFLLPYLELRQLGFNPRSLAETIRFKADVFSFFTASERLAIWGSIARAFPVAEGELFPGLTIALLAALAVADSWRRARAGRAPRSSERLLGWSIALSGIVVVALFMGWSVRLPGLRITSLWRAVSIAALLAAALLATSRGARRTLAAAAEGPALLFAIVAIAAALMALGPEISARGRVVEGTAPYAAFYAYVPGVDGLRVPARFAMILTLGLAVLAGLGADALMHRPGGRPLVAIAGLLIVAESWAAPIVVNYNDTGYRQAGLAPLPDALAIGSNRLPVYDAVAALPPDAVVLELPLGEPAFDVRYMLYGLAHGRALVNGFSGGAPLDYQLLTETLEDALQNPEQAWAAVAGSAATHIIVHEASYSADRGARITDWLRSHGARAEAAFGSDRLLRLR